MTEQSFDDLADAIETFTARVQTYETLVDRHEPGRDRATERVERYITDGLGDSEGLVEAWMEAADAAEELRDRDGDDIYETADQGASMTPHMLPDTAQSRVDYQQLSHRLWQEFFEAQQRITAHEQYALRNFKTTPVQYRMEVDEEYYQRME